MMLKLGDHGEAVKELQRNLNKLGSLLLIDGDFGPITQAAIVDARIVLKRPEPPYADHAARGALADIAHPSADLAASGVELIGLEAAAWPAELRAGYPYPICAAQ